VTGMTDLNRFGMQVEQSRIPLPMLQGDAISMMQIDGRFAVDRGSLYFEAYIPDLARHIPAIRMPLIAVMCEILAPGTSASAGNIESCMGEAFDQALNTIDLSDAYNFFKLQQFTTTTRGVEQNGLTPFVTIVDLPALLTSPEFNVALANIMSRSMGGTLMLPDAQMSEAELMAALEAQVQQMETLDPAAAEQFRQQVETLQAGGGSIEVQPSLELTADSLPPLSLRIEHLVDMANPRIRRVIVNFGTRFDVPDETGVLEPWEVNIALSINLDGYDQPYVIVPPPDARVLNSLSEITPALLAPPA